MTETSHEIVSEQSIKPLCSVNATSQPGPQIIEEVSMKEASHNVTAKGHCVMTDNTSQTTLCIALSVKIE